MKDYRNKKDNEKPTRSDKSDKAINEKDNQNIRLALAIEELCSDDFSFESIDKTYT